METFVLHDIEMPIKVYNNHIDELTNRIFKILCICEQCEAQQNYQNYFEYLDKIAILMAGNKVLFNNRKYSILLTEIMGLNETHTTDHAQVKKIVLECTNSLQKMKKPLVEGG